jgi:hypothetical protein
VIPETSATSDGSARKATMRPNHPDGVALPTQLAKGQQQRDQCWIDCRIADERKQHCPAVETAGYLSRLMSRVTRE